MLSQETPVSEFLDALTSGKSLEEQVAILRNCFDHAVDHPWVDEEVKDSIYGNICREYKVNFTNLDELEERNEEGD